MENFLQQMYYPSTLHVSEKTFLENFKPIKYYGWLGKYTFWQLHFFWSLAHCVLTYLLHDIPEKVPHWKCNRHGPYRRSEIWIGDDVLHHHDYWIGQDQGQILKIEQIDTTILYQIVLTRKLILTLLFLICTILWAKGLSFRERFSKGFPSRNNRELSKRTFDFLIHLTKVWGRFFYLHILKDFHDKGGLENLLKKRRCTCT